jgi:hypothetical protein
MAKIMFMDVGSTVFARNVLGYVMGTPVLHDLAAGTFRGYPRAAHKHH